MTDQGFEHIDGTSSAEPFKWLVRGWRWFLRLFKRTKLKAQGRLAETSTMGDYAKLEAMPDDKKPALVRPKDGPYADLINRVRLYAKDGAKALGPLLDRPLTVDGEPLSAILLRCQEIGADDAQVAPILDMLCCATPDMIDAVYTAYNSPWTVEDGEVWEVVTDSRVTH